MERTPEQIRHHYEIEKRLAAQLMNLPREQRRALSVQLHEELYRLVPDHPLRTRKDNPEYRQRGLERELRFLKPWLKSDTVFLEIGAAGCELSLSVAPLVKQVIAVDIVDHTAEFNPPSNLRHVISDGLSIPAEDITVAYSNQLMEHLHPDDAEEQLDNICDALAPGGAYICITPNRLQGPHDVSRHFDEVATGFHLHEYTVCELANLFSRRFSRVTWGPKSGVEVSVAVGKLYEVLCRILPRPLRMKVPLPLMLVGYKGHKS